MGSFHRTRWRCGWGWCGACYLLWACFRSVIGSHYPLLAMLILPPAAAIALLVLRRQVGQVAARQFALAVSLATLVASLWLVYQFVQLPEKTVDRARPVEPRFSVPYHWFTYVHEP